jgi:hypothetical protein
MQACAASYTLTYVNNLKLHLVNYTVVGLTAAMLKLLTRPSMSSPCPIYTYIWIYVVQDFF